MLQKPSDSNMAKVKCMFPVLSTALYLARLDSLDVFQPCQWQGNTFRDARRSVNAATRSPHCCYRIERLRDGPEKRYPGLKHAILCILLDHGPALITGLVQDDAEGGREEEEENHRSGSSTAIVARDRPPESPRSVDDNGRLFKFTALTKIVKNDLFPERH